MSGIIWAACAGRQPIGSPDGKGRKAPIELHRVLS